MTTTDPSPKVAPIPEETTQHAVQSAFRWLEFGPLLFFALAALALWWIWPKGHSGAVTTVTWSSNGFWIASGGHDGKILLRNVAKKSIDRRLQVPFRKYKGIRVTSVRFRPRRQQLQAAYSNRQVVSWNSQQWKWLSEKHFRNPVQRIRCSRRGGRCAFVSSRRVYLEHPQPDRTKGLRLRIKSKGGFFSASWSPDGSQLAVAGQGILRIYTMKKGAKPRLLKIKPTLLLQDVAWSPDGRWIAAGGTDDLVRIWNASTGSLYKLFKGHYGAVTALAWSADNKQLASGDVNGDLWLWGLDKDGRKQRITGHEKRISDLQWHPSKPLFVSSSFDSTLRLWDATTGKILQRW